MSGYKQNINDEPYFVVDGVTEIDNTNVATSTGKVMIDENGKSYYFIILYVNDDEILIKITE